MSFPLFNNIKLLNTVFKKTVDRKGFIALIKSIAERIINKWGSAHTNPILCTKKHHKKGGGLPLKLIPDRRLTSSGASLMKFQSINLR